MNPANLSFLLLFLVAPLLAQQPIHTWDFTRARVSSDFAEVPDTVSDNTLTFVGAGARIVAENASPSGRQFTLDGSQREPAKTARIIEAMDSVMLKVRFKPSGQGERLQTIVGLFGTYEVRYDNERQTVEFIVSYPEKKYVNAKVPAPWLAWTEIVATYKDGRLTISNGETRAEAFVPPGGVPAPGRAYPRIGRGSAERPYSGVLAEISLYPY